MITKFSLAMLFTLLIGMSSSVLLPSPAKASTSQCYSAAEADAENLLRLHSKLMVAAVTCRRGVEGQDLGAAYVAFTKQNISSIREAEKTLTAYYKNTYGGDAVSRLDKLRTILANEFGQQVADVSSATFCAKQSSYVVNLRDAPAPLVAAAVKTLSNISTTKAPLCSDKIITAQVEKK